MKKLFRNIFLSFVVAFVLPFLTFFAINQITLRENTFENGCMLCGVDVSGLTISEAENLISKSLDEKSALTLTYKGKKWEFQSSDFEISSNVHFVLDELQKGSRKGVFEKNKLIKKIKNMGFASEVATNYVFTGLDDKIDEIATQIEIEPTRAKAKYNFSSKTFDITPGIKGQKIDRASLYEDISKIGNQKAIEIKTLPVVSDITSDFLKKSLIYQAEYSTNYASSSADRKNNIKLASSSLNNCEILPNEEFSFNKTLGQRTLERGYKEANIIKEGAFVKGVGGGICQVSTTLYNALLLSGINVTEAHKHTLPVSYVPPARDAMVSWGSADLKFVNTTDAPLYIVSNADGENITFKIFGKTKEKDEKIKITSEVVSKISAKDKILPDTDGKYADKIMFKGEFVRAKYGKDGYEAKSFVEKYKNGKLVSKKLLRDGVYDAQDGIIYEGTDTLPEGMRLPSDNIISSVK